MLTRLAVDDDPEQRHAVGEERVGEHVRVLWFFFRRGIGGIGVG